MFPVWVRKSEVLGVCGELACARVAGRPRNSKGRSKIPRCVDAVYPSKLVPGASITLYCWRCDCALPTVDTLVGIEQCGDLGGESGRKG